MKLEDIITPARRALVDKEDKKAVLVISIIIIFAVGLIFKHLFEVREQLSSYFWLALVVVLLISMIFPFDHRADMRRAILYNAIGKVKDEESFGEACMFAEARGWDIKNNLEYRNVTSKMEYSVEKYYKFQLDRARKLTEIMATLPPGDSFLRAKRDLDLLCSTKTSKFLQKDPKYCEQAASSEFHGEGFAEK